MKQALYTINLSSKDSTVCSFKNAVKTKAVDSSELLWYSVCLSDIIQKTGHVPKF